MTSILSDTLAPPRIATNGRSGLLDALAQVLELLLHQEPGRAFAARTAPCASIDACARCAAPNASLT